MKVLLVAMVIFVAKANAWFFRNSETTATADGRGIDDGCEAFGEAGSCEFFDCFEQRLPCGRDFYMQRYGNNYCNRFNTFMESFTEAGQEFLVNSQQCVTRRLLEYYRRDYINCHDLEHDAIAMIGPCYMESGFCDIIGDNTEQFIEVFEFNDLFGSGSANRQLPNPQMRSSPRGRSKKKRADSHHHGQGSSNSNGDSSRGRKGTFDRPTQQHRKGRTKLTHRSCKSH